MHTKKPLLVRKTLFFLLILAVTLPLFAQEAQSFQIVSTTYIIQGSTTERALRNEVTIDYSTQFTSRQSLEAYLTDLLSQFNNVRQLENVSIKPMYQEAQNGIIPVNLEIITEDTWNIIVLPIPTYSSNDGFEMQVQLDNYNFLGSLKKLTSEFKYMLDEEGRNKIGLEIEFDLPFTLFSLDSEWNNEHEVQYVFGQRDIIAELSTGLTFTLPFANKHKFEFGFEQSFMYNQIEYPNQDPFFVEKVFMRLPLTLATIPNWGDVILTPSLTYTLNWGVDAFTQNTDGISDPDLKGPVLDPAFKFETERINWVGNFREGLSLSFKQSFPYNFYDGIFEPNITTSIAAHKGFSYLGFSAKTTWVHNINSTDDELGRYIRGILDEDPRMDDSGALFFSFDMPIKIIQTDWVAWGFWDWMRYFDFEMQWSPFVDIALMNTQGNYLTAGLDVILFPTKLRSVIARISAGFEVLPWESVNSTLGKNELYLGFGFFY